MRQAVIILLSLLIAMMMPKQGDAAVFGTVDRNEDTPQYQEGPSNKQKGVKESEAPHIISNDHGMKSGEGKKSGGHAQDHQKSQVRDELKESERVARLMQKSKSKSIHAKGQNLFIGLTGSSYIGAAKLIMILLELFIL